MRYIFKKPVAWADELTRYLFVWLSFFGAALAIRDKKHVAVEGIINLFPSTIGKFLGLIGDFLSLGITSIILYYGIGTLERLMQQFSAGMQIPMIIPYIAIPLCFLYLWLTIAYNIGLTVKSLVTKGESD